MGCCRISGGERKGDVIIRVLHTPGHTPESIAPVVSDLPAKSVGMDEILRFDQGRA